MELSPIQLEDLRDPQIRRALYSYIERMLIRTTDPNSINSNEIVHLHQTINALETNIRIWNIGTPEDEAEEMEDPEQEQEAIPDAQPLDYDHPVFNGQFTENLFLSVESDVDTEIDEVEHQREYNELPSLELPEFDTHSIETLRETELNSLFSTTIQRTYSIPTRNYEVSSVSFTEYVQSIYRREPERTIKFNIQRYPITKLMLKNSAKTACSICMESPGILHMAVSQCCSNTFCINCIKTWEQSCTSKRCNATCPLCRSVGPEIKIYCESNM